MDRDKMGVCQNCMELVLKEELQFVNDNYGIPFKNVCGKCYDTVKSEIRKNDYGKYLTNSEIYGDDDY